MVLSNASSKSRNMASLVNQNQGGGSKKAGFPYQVGRSTAASVILGSVDPVHGHCCTLPSYQATLFPSVRISRPISTLVGNWR